MIQECQHGAKYVKKEIKMTIVDTDGEINDVSRIEFRNQLYTNADIMMIAVGTDEEIRSEDLDAWRLAFH